MVLVRAAIPGCFTEKAGFKPGSARRIEPARVGPGNHEGPLAPVQQQEDMAVVKQKSDRTKARH
jgi:hypothetical protein